MICPKCGEEVPQELETCPNCGAAMTAPEQDADSQPAVLRSNVHECFTEAFSGICSEIFFSVVSVVLSDG